MSPITVLDVVIVVRSVQCRILIGQQLQMGMRHHPRMPVIRITPVREGKRGLREAEKQRKGARDCRQTIQDSSQSMF